MFKLTKNTLEFPPVSLANKDGLLAFGGDLSVERLLNAYKNGIFPWYDQNEEILWWAPDPRMVLFPEEVKISKSMRSLIRKKLYTITENQAFEQVIQKCAEVKRPGQQGTWLNQDMIKAYTKLYYKGKAFSVEVWNKKNELVGGLYGVINNKRVWSGESMFHLEANTSKLAFIYLAKKSQEKNVQIIDCQIHTPHLASMGARQIPRSEFMTYLQPDK